MLLLRYLDDSHSAVNGVRISGDQYWLIEHLLYLHFPHKHTYTIPHLFIVVHKEQMLQFALTASIGVNSMHRG